MQPASKMAFLVLGYPQLARTDFESIQHYRKENDRLFYKIAAPHFTIVFPVAEITEEQFTRAVISVSGGLKKINFILRSAVINKDAFNDYYHTFLVPDEGYSQISNLHDILYSGSLKKYLRTDIAYIPHIGTGNSKDRYECEKMVAEWNHKNFAISGIISSLTLAEFNNNTLTHLKEIELC